MLRLDLPVQHSLPFNRHVIISSKQYKPNIFVVVQIAFITYCLKFLQANRRKDQTGFESLHSSLPVEHLLRFQLYV